MNSLKKLTKIIGWGADLTFDYCDTHYPIDVSFFVDNDKAKHGSNYKGIDIFPPAI